VPRRVNVARGLHGSLPEARIGARARPTPVPGARARFPGRPWYGGTAAGRRAISDTWRHALGDIARGVHVLVRQHFGLPLFECV
jgi:hypothetical protein